MDPKSFPKLKIRNQRYFTQDSKAYGVSHTGCFRRVHLVFHHERNMRAPLVVHACNVRVQEYDYKIFISRNLTEMLVNRMVLYPSKKWLEEYCRILNQSKEYKEAGKGWGVGWNGDFIFQIENIPIDKISVENLPADLAKELKEHVINGTSYSYIQLKDGECKGARPLKDPKEVEVGFIMKGPYENWKKLTKGEIGAIRGLLTRKFKLEGSMAQVTRYTRAASIMTSISSSIKTEFIDEVYAKK